MGFNLGQGIDKAAFGSDYYFQGGRGFVDWRTDTAVSGMSTYVGYQAISALLMQYELMKMEHTASNTTTTMESSGVDNIANDVATSKSSADFYVRPNGDVIPSTGFRYMPKNASYLDDLNKTMVIPENKNGTYFSFDKYNRPNPGALQVPHDGTIRGSFNTLQIIDDLRIPYGNWGKAKWLEPITTDFPEYGLGGATQAITNHSIELYELKNLLGNN